MPGYIPVEYTADSFFYIKSPNILSTDSCYVTGTCTGTLTDNVNDAKCLIVDTAIPLSYNNNLCKNMNLAKQLVSIQNNNGEIQSYTDTNDQYLMEYYRTFNLSFGIIGILAFYYYA